METTPKNNEGPSKGFVVTVISLLGLILYGITSQQHQSQPTTPPPTQPTATISAKPAPAPTKPKEHWQYISVEDEMTGKPIHSAMTESTNKIDMRWPHGNGVTARLVIVKHPRAGQNVIIMLESGHILCHTDSCEILARFDDNPPIRLTGSPPADHNITTVFLNSERFLKRARQAKRVKLSIPLYQEGAPTFSFTIAGLEWPPKTQLK